MGVFKLPQAFKAKWVKALRSGRYKQTTDVLCNFKGYCCLGVGERISGVDKDALLDKCMPSDIKGVKAEKRMPRIPNGTLNKLSRMNDGGDSFKEIADYIEKRL